jgi:hypothetical protein
MTPAAPTAWPADGVRLLEPSISYALGAVQAVTPELLSRPTPCREWDLRMLLRHTSESLAAIGEGIEAGRAGLEPAAEDGALVADPARAFRDRAGQLLDAWTSSGHQRQVIEIAGCPLAGSPRDRRPRVGHIPGLRAAPADPTRPRHQPAGDSSRAGPPHRPAPPVRGTSHRRSHRRPQRPTRRLPRARSHGIAHMPGH